MTKIYSTNNLSTNRTNTDQKPTIHQLKQFNTLPVLISADSNQPTGTGYRDYNIVNFDSWSEIFAIKHTPPYH